MADFLTIDQIEQHADLARQRANQLALPINPILIAEGLGVPVRQARFNDSRITGQIECKDGQTTIWVKAGDPLPRMRFTVAHEIGHKVLHHPENQFVTYDYILYRRGDESGATPDRQEFQANAFAAALLMPREWVIDEFRRDRSVLGLAERFGVSEQAMAYRLQNLGLIHG